MNLMLLILYAAIALSVYAALSLRNALLMLQSKKVHAGQKRRLQKRSRRMRALLFAGLGVILISLIIIAYLSSNNSDI